MDQKITCCGDCPFMYSEYDDYSLYNDTIDICTYALFLSRSDKTGKKEYFIDSYNGVNDRKVQKPPPDWCPLRKDTITFKFID